MEAGFGEAAVEGGAIEDRLGHECHAQFDTAPPLRFPNILAPPKLRQAV